MVNPLGTEGDAGIPSVEEIKQYNDECRRNRPYTGPDVVAPWCGESSETPAP